MVVEPRACLRSVRFLFFFFSSLLLLRLFMHPHTHALSLSLSLSLRYAGALHEHQLDALLLLCFSPRYVLLLFCVLWSLFRCPLRLCRCACCRWYCCRSPRLSLSLPLFVMCTGLPALYVYVRLLVVRVSVLLLLARRGRYVLVLWDACSFVCCLFVCVAMRRCCTCCC